jgi:hypothetical protein
MEKAVTVTFTLHFIFPHHSKHVLMASFSYYIAIQLAMLAALPHSIKGTRAHHCHPRLQFAYRRQQL